MSTAIPSVHDCLARINRDIERCERPRDGVMLEIYRDHWWAEVLSCSKLARMKVAIS
jgi:hypothetical protein